MELKAVPKFQWRNPNTFTFYWDDFSNVSVWEDALYVQMMDPKLVHTPVCSWTGINAAEQNRLNSWLLLRKNNFWFSSRWWSFAILQQAAADTNWLFEAHKMGVRQRVTRKLKSIELEEKRCDGRLGPDANYAKHIWVSVLVSKFYTFCDLTKKRA